MSTPKSASEYRIINLPRDNHCDNLTMEKCAIKGCPNFRSLHSIYCSDHPQSRPSKTHNDLPVLSD